MRRSLFAVLAIGCAAPPVYVTTDAGGDAATDDRPLVVEAWDVELTSRTDPIHSALLRGVIDRLSDDTSDVVCVSNLHFDAATVVDAVKSNYPFHAERAIDPTTPYDDARDANGDVPTLPTTAPCSASDEAPFAASVDCISACAGGRDHYEFSCASKCFSESLAPRCLACLQMHAAELAPPALKGDCFTRPNAEMSTAPRSDAVLLSKRPLSNVRHHLFPGWLNPAPVVEATVSAWGRDVTVFCATSIGGGEPYGGVYGAPFLQGGMSVGEALLQVRRIVDLAFAHGGEAIVLASLPTGWTAPKSGKNKTDSLWWEVEANLVPLVGPDSKVGCLVCSTNPLFGYLGIPGQNYAATHVLTTPGAMIRATSLERTATDASVSFDGASFPPSVSFGIRALLESSQGAD
jgi:hypothetical protein